LEAVRASHHFEHWWDIVINDVELLGEYGLGIQPKKSCCLAILAYKRPGPVFHLPIPIHHVVYAAHSGSYFRTHEGLPIQPTISLGM
jgi:hypothetical protein